MWRHLWKIFSGIEHYENERLAIFWTLDCRGALLSNLRKLIVLNERTSVIGWFWQVAPLAWAVVETRYYRRNLSSQNFARTLRNCLGRIHIRFLTGRGRIFLSSPICFVSLGSFTPSSSQCREIDNERDGEWKGEEREFEPVSHYEF